MNTVFLLLLLPAQSDIFSDWMDSIDPVAPAVIIAEPELAVIVNSPQQQLLNITLAYNNRLTPHNYLMDSAQAVADYHARTGRWGHSSRSARPGASENIAWNSQRSVNKISSQWKNSRGHNSNWLSNWNYAGVGVAYTDGRIYAVQHFANNPVPHNSITLQSNRVANSRNRRWGLFRRRR